MSTNGELRSALQTWAPQYPRRVTRHQQWVESDSEAIDLLIASEMRGGDSPFISTYAFPNGHPSDGEVPVVDTLFIDFDIEDGEYERGSGNRNAWQRDLSHLLVRARQVATEILDNNAEAGWRAALSGHKGIHLFLDFPRLPSDLGENEEYVQGLNEYANELINDLSKRTGISDLSQYVDVTSSDLSRLCRVPNTLHGAATDSFGEERYCVPVSIRELAEMTPTRYEELTREPRRSPYESRSPVSEVGDIIEQYVRLAEPETHNYTSTGRQSTLDYSRVEEYRRESNDKITLDDIPMVTSDMPCVWEFHKREDKYQHGNQSHEMESHCIAKLTEANVPIDVIKEFLANAPDYDEQYSESRIEELIARDFNPYTTEKLLERAPEFCGYDFCARCQQAISQNPTLQ